MLGGELDMDAVAQVDMYLRRSFGPFFFRRTLLFDLAGVTMIDSSFVAYLVGLAGKVRQSGHDLVLSRPAGQARRTLGLVGMPNLVPVYESLEEAAELIASGRVPLIPPPFAVPAGETSAVRWLNGGCLAAGKDREADSCRRSAGARRLLLLAPCARAACLEGAHAARVRAVLARRVGGDELACRRARGRRYAPRARAAAPAPVTCAGCCATRLYGTAHVGEGLYMESLVLQPSIDAHAPRLVGAHAAGLADGRRAPCGPAGRPRRGSRSWLGLRGDAGRECFVARAIDAEDAVQAGDLEDAGDVLVGADDVEAAVRGPHALGAADEHAESSGVNEGDPAEVDDDAGGTVVDAGEAEPL